MARRARETALDFDPDKLVLVPETDHPLSDGRVHWPVNESIVRNIMFQGVPKPAFLIASANLIAYNLGRGVEQSGSSSGS